MQLFLKINLICLILFSFQTGTASAQNCNYDWDCYGSKVCMSGTCFLPDCLKDADCGSPKKWKCRDRMCKRKSILCTTTAQCPVGQKCLDSLCRPGHNLDELLDLED